MLPCTVSSHVCAGLNQCNTKTHTILSPCLYPPAIKHKNVNPLMNLAHIYRKRTSILGDVTEMFHYAMFDWRVVCIDPMNLVCTNLCKLYLFSNKWRGALLKFTHGNLLTNALASFTGTDLAI